MNNQIEKSITTSKGNITYWDTDNGMIPIIFVHDLLMCKEVFAKQIAVLSNYRMIAIDLPGHGNSDDAIDLDTYSFTGYAELLNEFMDLLNITDYISFGWSYGCTILIELHRMREGYKGFIMVGYNIIHHDTNGGMCFFDKIPCTSYPLFPSIDYKCVLEKNGDVDDDDVVKYIETCAMTDMLELKDVIKRSDNNVRVCLKNKLITDPTKRTSSEAPYIAIAGEHDEGATAEILVRVFGDIFVQIDGAYHAPFWDKSNEFNIIMTNFLNELS